MPALPCPKAPDAAVGVLSSAARGLLLILCCGAAGAAQEPAAESRAPAAASREPADRLQQWPHWRGPRVDGVAPFADPPLHWDEQTNVRWKRELPGEGNSTPIVWGDQVFVLVARDTGREADAEELAALRLAAADQKTIPPGKFIDLEVLALDRSTGDTRWQTAAAQFLPREGLHPANTYASASPLTDGQRLFVSFGSRGLFCYDLAGKLLWQRDMGPMKTRAGWGEGSPRCGASCCS